MRGEMVSNGTIMGVRHKGLTEVRLLVATVIISTLVLATVLTVLAPLVE